MAAPISSVDRCYRTELQIDAGICARCGLCASLCPAEVFVCDAGSVARVANVEFCRLCYACELNCPTHALRFVRLAPSFTSETQEPVLAPGQIVPSLQERALQ